MWKYIAAAQNGTVPLFVDKELNKSLAEEINEFGWKEKFIFTASLHLFTKSLLLQRPATLALTNKDMLVWLPWQPQSSVISAGFKHSRESHTSEMVHGKRLMVSYSMCYLCTTMGVNSCLVTSFPFTQHFCRGSWKNMSKLQWAMYYYVTEPQIWLLLPKFSLITGLVFQHSPHLVF